MRTLLIFTCLLTLLSCNNQNKTKGANRTTNKDIVDTLPYLTGASSIVAHGDILDSHTKEDIIKKYYAKLLEKYKENTGIAELIISEQKAWLEYYEATSDAYYKIVLGKTSYQFKNDHLINYKIAICEQRIMALQSMLHENLSVWNFNDTCRWDEVGYEYDRIEKYITKEKRHKNNFLLSQQIRALRQDKSKFHKYLNTRFELAHKVNIYDESYLLHYKSVMMREMF